MTDVNINKFEEELIRRGDSRGALESMLARFNRSLQGSGIFKELKEHESYEKPSARRRRKHREALARMRKGKDNNAVHKNRGTNTVRPSNQQPSIGVEKG